MASVRVMFSRHAFEKMFERKITPEQVLGVVRRGRVIEEYPTDKPFPSVLILGYHSTRPLHVVVATDDATKTTHIITAYEPSRERWSEDFSKRR